MRVIKCSDCGRELPNDADRCVVWELPNVRFICIPCSNSEAYKQVDPTKDDREQAG